MTTVSLRSIRKAKKRLRKQRKKQKALDALRTTDVTKWLDAKVKIQKGLYYKNKNNSEKA